MSTWTLQDDVALPGAGAFAVAPSEAVIDAAERFVVPLIEGARDFEGDQVIADTAGIGMAISDWKRPEPRWSADQLARWCRGIEDHFRWLFPRRKPRPLTADRCARVILDGFDGDLLHIEDYGIEAIELLLALSPECGPTNRRKLIRFVEAYVEHASDEDFEVEPVVDHEARQLEVIRKYSRTMGIVVLDGVLDEERLERGPAEP